MIASPLLQSVHSSSSFSYVPRQGALLARRASTSLQARRSYLPRSFLSCTASRTNERIVSNSLKPRPLELEAEVAPPCCTTEQDNQVEHELLKKLVGSGVPATRLLSFVALSGVLGTSFGLEGPGSTLQALAVLASIVAVHEAGHFFAARLQGIHVTKFSIGFGPALWQYQGKEVEYALRAIPLGGYIAFPDDDPNSTIPPDDPDLLKNRSIPERALVISAGVLANIVFAYTVLFAQVSTVGKVETAYLPGVEVPEVVAGSAAERAGLKAGDVILGINKYEVLAAPDQVAAVVQKIRASAGEEVILTVQRGDEKLELPCVPDPMNNGQGKIGVQLSAMTYLNHIKSNGPLDAAVMAASEVQRMANIVLTGLNAIVTNFGKMASQLSGPVAIIAAGSEIARTDSAGLFQFCAIVNINLAIVNVLPLPALDGGYLVLLLLEAIRGRKLPSALENGVMTSGLLVLLVLGVGLVIRDTINLL